MLENNDKISFITLIQLFSRKKIKIIALSLLTTLFVVLSLNLLNIQYKLNHFKFSYKQLDENISYRKGVSFYSDLITGKKISDLLNNLGLNYNFQISISNTIPFKEVIYIFTNEFIEEIKYEEKYKNLNFIFSNKMDRSFSNTLIIRSEDINFSKYKKEIIDTFNNELNNHLDEKIKFLYKIINFQLIDKINELDKANLYLLVNNASLKETKKLDKTKTLKKTKTLTEKIEIIENLMEKLEDVDININLGDFIDESNDFIDESNDPYLQKYNENAELISFIEEGVIQEKLEEDLKQFIKNLSINPLFNIQYYEKNNFTIKPFFVSLYAYVIYFILIFFLYIFLFAYINFFKSK